MLASPMGMLKMGPAVKDFPQETFAALQDYPADYLKRYDQLCPEEHLTGVSANDAHHNQAYKATIVEGGKLHLVDALDKTVAKLDPEKIPPLKLLVGNKQPGDTVFEIDLDPYERSIHHVSTHLLMHVLTEDNVWEALRAGRAYVAFDWIADPSGFVFQAEAAGKTFPMGSDVPLSADLHLKAEAPLESTFKLIRNGEPLTEQTTTAIDIPIDKPGVYRVEVWQTLPASRARGSCRTRCG